MASFNLFSPGIAQRKNSAMNKLDKYIITLVGLRLYLQVTDMTYRYNVPPSVISKAFTEIADLLYEKLKNIILWPSKEELTESNFNCIKRKLCSKSCLNN